MNNSQTVTNEMLYELIKEFKRDVYKRFDQIDKRFDQIDKRFEQMDKRFDQQDKRMDQQDVRLDRMEDDRREDHRLLQQIHESRHEVKVQFHWKLAAASVAISAGVSVVVFLAMSSLMA